jgi:hypothetical protein
MTWLERVPTLSINPDMATREDVVRLAGELIRARWLLIIFRDMHPEESHRLEIDKFLEEPTP